MLPAGATHKLSATIIAVASHATMTNARLQWSFSSIAKVAGSPADVRMGSLPLHAHSDASQRPRAAERLPHPTAVAG